MRFFFAFCTELQDDQQKWRENNFWQKVADDSEDTLEFKILSKSLYLAPFLRY